MEQIVKLTGRIAEVMPLTSGVSQRTGNQWKSQDYLFEYFSWSGAKYPNRILCRIFGENDIAKFNLMPLEENVTLTLRFDANKSQDGTRWFNEVRITNVERVGEQKPAPAANEAPTNGDPSVVVPQQEEKKDDLPF